MVAAWARPSCREQFFVIFNTVEMVSHCYILKIVIGSIESLRTKRGTLLHLKNSYKPFNTTNKILIVDI